jgi:hypothetical protein
VDLGSRYRVVNISFVLCAIDEAAPLHDPAKLQAAMCLLEIDLKDKGLSGPHFTFIQSRRGPFSKELWDTFDELEARGFVDGKALNLTERGEFLRNLILPELRAIPENDAVFAITDAILKKCQPETGKSLLEKVSEMALLPEGHSETAKLKDLPPDTVLIVPVAGRLKVPEDLARLFFQEFELSQEQITKAGKDWPEIESRALDRLRRAMSEDQPT